MLESGVKSWDHLLGWVLGTRSGEGTVPFISWERQINGK